MKQQNLRHPEISRVSRSREDARASYDRMSKWYDVLAGSERRFVDMGINELAPAQGQRMLEIGYGTGHALIRLARAVGDAGMVYGIDISEGMRAIAEKRIEREGLCCRVQLSAGDATVLPFDSGSLDAIFMSFTLELFDTPEIPVVLEECGRVLAPRGRIGVVSMAAEEHPGLALRLYEWAHQRFPTAVDCRPILVKESLQGAGFHLLQASRYHMWGLPLDICLAAKGPTSASAGDDAD